MKTNLKRSYTLFYLLVIYILFQFIWWEILLVKQTQSIHQEKEKLMALVTSDAEKLNAELIELKNKEKLQTYMIVGEGTVFLILISLGIVRVYHTFNRETSLARQQNNFLLSVSHELKTPLAGIKLNTETIQLRSLPDETRNKLLGNIIQETDRLNFLVENLLITSRLDGSAPYTIKKEKIELNQWLSELIFKSFKPSDQELIKLNPREEVYGTIDKLLFPSALINVIENAIKYSSRQAIEIQIETSKNTLEILISDRGTGIPDTEKKAIFERFYRIGNEETRKTQGTGLGLYISNEILRLHGGEIVVVDRSGGGSVFKLILPS